MSEIKRVLIIGVDEDCAGIANVVMNFYRNINRNQIQFDFISASAGIAYKDEIKSMGGNIYTLHSRRRNIFKYRKEIDNFFKNNASKYIAVWYHSTVLSNLNFIKSAKKYKVPKIIIHSHASHNLGSIHSYFMHIVGRKKAEKIATDFWSCGELASKWFYSQKIINSSKHKIIFNSIDTNDFKFNENVRQKIRKELNLKDEFLIGHTGRLRREKNQEFLIKVFDEIKKEKKDAKLVIIGSGEDLDKLVTLAKDLKHENDIMFLGFKSNVNDYYQAIDCFVFPSLYEGFPMSLIEAQTSGLPIYASDTITDKVKILDNFRFLNIEKSPKEWADEILKTYKHTDRTTAYKEIIDAGFDNKTNIKVVTNELNKR